MLGELSLDFPCLFVLFSIPRMNPHEGYCQNTARFAYTAKPRFKQLSGIEKVHRISIEITVDFCERLSERSRIKAREHQIQYAAI